MYSEVSAKKFLSAFCVAFLLLSPVRTVLCHMFSSESIFCWNDFVSFSCLRAKVLVKNLFATPFKKFSPTVDPPSGF